MADTGLNAVKIENERMLVLEDRFGWDKARLLAVDHKVKAMSNLLSILSKPNAADIDIVYEERRYQAFWHIAGYSSFEFIRPQSYQINLQKNVREVKLLGEEFKIGDEGRIVLAGKERCEEDYREEFLINAQSDSEGDFAKYLKFPFFEIKATDELIKDGTQIVNMKVNSGNLIRKMMLKLAKPIEAEKMLREEIRISELALYFHPVYVFEYHDRVKNKKALVSFDGVTGEFNAKAAKISDVLKNSFDMNDLFEFSKEIAQNLVPGGGLAVMVGKKVMEITKK